MFPKEMCASLEHFRVQADGIVAFTRGRSAAARKGQARGRVEKPELKIAIPDFHHSGGASRHDMTFPGSPVSVN